MVFHCLPTIQTLYTIIRWHNHLDPRIVTAPWSKEEDRIIMEVIVVPHDYTMRSLNALLKSLSGTLYAWAEVASDCKAPSWAHR